MTADYTQSGKHGKGWFGLIHITEGQIITETAQSADFSFRDT